MTWLLCFRKNSHESHRTAKYLNLQNSSKLCAWWWWAWDFEMPSQKHCASGSWGWWMPVIFSGEFCKNVEFPEHKVIRAKLNEVLFCQPLINVSSYSYFCTCWYGPSKGCTYRPFRKPTILCFKKGFWDALDIRQVFKNNNTNWYNQNASINYQLFIWLRRQR